MPKSKAFFAYPADNPLIRDAIHGLNDCESAKDIEITIWENMNALGTKLDDRIRDEINDADVILADITCPNYNVLYEVGFAMALGKPVIPTVNIAFSTALANVTKLGLIDTISFAKYSNAEELSQSIRNWNNEGWVNRTPLELNYSQPLFVLDMVAKPDFRNWIFSAIENSGVNFRHFDPTETSRLSATTALVEVSASAGVIIPLSPTELVDSEFHNLRASFLLGLAHGFDVEVLLIQYNQDPVPLDYRDFVTNSVSQFETSNHVLVFCQETLLRNQRPTTNKTKQNIGILGHINLGSTTAENESQKLAHYFVQTAQYSQALRAQSAIVTGRKGSGKSAIFLQVADHYKEKYHARCVVDLRPASHNLSEMREALVGVKSHGIFDHTIAAFWQYIIYIEILLKLRELLLPQSKHDIDLQRQIDNIENQFNLTEVSGDFTSRLKKAVEIVIAETRKAKNTDSLRTELTNIMFEEPIPKLRKAVIELSSQFDGIHILLDDLDKGWPPLRVESQDVLMIKHLIETLNRIGKDIRNLGKEFYFLLFLRSDIYDRLVQETSDRGKYDVINVDWSDPEQLENILTVRVQASLGEAKFQEGWNALNPKFKSGHAIDSLITASLMRPRFLIDLCEKMLSFSVNRGHIIVDEVDVNDAIERMSLYLVSDFGYEMRDIAGTSENIFYLFIDVGRKLSNDELFNILSSYDELGLGVEETIDLLLWYGFLGIIDKDNEPIFIYDKSYDYRRLQAEREAAGSKVSFAINPAFINGLE